MVVDKQQQQQQQNYGDDDDDDISAMIAPAQLIPISREVLLAGLNSGRPKSTRIMNMNMRMMRMRVTRWPSSSSSLIFFGYSGWLIILVIFLNCSKSEIIPQPSSSSSSVSSSSTSLSPISIPFGLPSTSSSTSLPLSSSAKEAPEVGANCSKWNPFNLWTMKNGDRNRHNKRSLMFKRKRLKNNKNKNKNNGQQQSKWPMLFYNDTQPMVTFGQYNHHNPNHHGHGHHGHPNTFYNKPSSSSSSSYYYHHQHYNNPHHHHQQQQQDDLNQNQGLIIHPQALAATAAAGLPPPTQHRPLLQPQPNPFLFALPSQTSSASSAQGSVEFPNPDPDQQFFMVGGSSPATGTAHGPMANLYAYHAHHHQPHAHLSNPSILYPTVFDFEDYHHLHQHDAHHQHDYHHHHKDHLPLDYDPMQWDGTNDSEEKSDHYHHHQHHRGQQQHYRKPNYKQNHVKHHHHHGNHGHHGHDDHHYNRDHHQNKPYKNEKYQGPRYGRPVAKDLISDKQNDSHYEPFPVDPIRGYYMGGSLSSSTSTYEDGDDDEDNGDGGDGGGGGEQYNGHGHDDHDDDHHNGGGYSGQDSGQDYNEINKHNHHHHHHHHHQKCYRRKQLNQNDLEWSLKQAYGKMKWYSKIIQKNAMDTRRRTPYIPNGVLDAKIWEYATFFLKQRMCLTKMDVVKMLPKIDGKKIQQYQYEMYACRQESYIICEPKARYRSIDGACNNLKKKTWSKSFTCHRRLLPPDYADGVAEPRQSSSSSSYNGVGKLPNARDLSSLLLPDVDVPDHRLTSMAMAFGQFIIHDVARTLPTANDIRCCPVKQANIHPECFAIEIKRPDDVLRKYYNQTCMNFVRSVVCNPCGLGPREQQNQATHTFDMSQMYGLRLNDSLSLRTYRGGKLRGSWTSTSPKEELPPKMIRAEPGCNIRPKPPRFKCFETADGIRASQHPALQSMHTVFHRRHNQHTDGLAKVNPHWSDEKLYQEARHITIAEVSNIIYGQYLSSVFGEKLMKHFQLNVKKQGYTKYNHKLNPSTLQEFIVAGGRFGHSQINQRFRVVFNDPKMSYSYRLRDNFFETTIVSLGHSGGILKGLSLDSTQASDPYFVDDVKNSLYHLRKERLGRDLPAFNIQRGREHGIPGYVYYLDFCFGFKVYNWNDLATFIPGKHLKKIRLFYRHWNDIDLFVGGVFERLMDGAAFGPTFGCINGIQFYNFKYGDRFYFEHGYQSGSFNLEQLDNIRKVSTLSSIICKTHPEMDQMPLNPFVKTSPMDNPMVPCFKFPELDYKLWVDTRYKKQKQQQQRKKTKPDEDDPPKSNGGGGKVRPQSSNAISDHHNGGYRDDNYGEEDDEDDDDYGGGGRTTVRPYGDHHKYGYSDKYHYQYRSDEYPDEYNQTYPPDKKQQDEDNYWDFGYNKQDNL